MPYELSFIKRLPRQEAEYINECCVNGDLIADRLQPAIEKRYGKVQAGQEDWGWFIWFDKDRVSLAVDVFTDDWERGEFRIHLTSRTKRLFGSRVQDTAELEELRELVVSKLAGWVDGPVSQEAI